MEKKPKILIVEDERIIALETKHRLESMGYDISAIVSSGEEAIRNARELQPDLVLMDIILKGEIDGVEAAGQIRTCFDIPVVYATASVTDAGLEKITHSEPFGCLFKPFEDIELQAAVKMALYKHKTEKRLNESEENYRSVVENSHDGISIIGEDYKIAYANDMFCQILGYSRSEIIGQDFTKFIDEEGKGLIVDSYKKRQAGKTPPSKYEFNVLRKDGTKRRVEISSTVSRDRTRRVRTIAQILDITDRMKAEQALRDSEKKYRALAETTTDTTFIIGLDGKFTYISPVVEKLTGYPWQDFIGRPFKEFVAPEYVESMVKRFKEGLAGKEIPLIEIEVRHKNGGTVSAEVNVSSIPDATGKTIGRIGVARDITERKHVEESLRKSEDKFRTIIERMEDGYFEVDLSGRFTFFNEAMCKIAGFSADEMTGMSNLEYTSPEMAKKIFNAFNKVYRTGKPADVEDYEIIKKGGSKRVLEFNASLMKNKKGEPVGFRGIARDVTKRKETEALLAESEKRYRNLVENMRDIFYVSDDKGIVTYISPVVEEIGGYRVEEIIGEPLTDFLHPEDVPRIAEHFQGVTSDIIKPYMCRFLIKSGEFIWMRTLSRPISENDRFAGIQGILTDITDIKKAAEALKESEERYRSVFENTGTATVILEEDTTILMVNAGFEKLSGYSREEIEGKMKWTEFVVSEDLEGLKEYALEMIKHRGEAPKEYEFRFNNKQGSIKHVFLRVGMIPGTNKSVASLMDITPLKRAEESLRQSEKKYRGFFETSKDVVYMSSTEGKFLDINNSGLKLFGIDREALDKVDVARDTYAEPKDRAAFTKAIEMAGYATAHEVNLKRMDGTVFPATITAVTVRGADGNITGYQGIIKDETERKYLEAQFQQAQKMEAVGTLAGGIAHDFNNLLTAIQGNASLMLMQIDPGNPEYEKLKKIEQCVKSGADLTKQLLGFARGGAYNVKPINLNDIVQKTSDMFIRTKKEIVIHAKYSDELRAAEVDPGQMEQVLMNLYVNAWQAMPAGGELYLETENVALDEDYVRPYEIDPGKYVKVSVTDTGVGMDEATRLRIFEPFFTTREMGRGTGLGLASAYGIIRHHRGIINVYSEKGHGTTFNIYLPASESGIRDQGAVVIEEGIRQGEGTILLVDDEEMIIDVATRLLQELGYKILTAGSGEEAIEIYRENMDAIDLVILDMIMPGLGGGETYDMLRDINSDVRVILSSGYSINGQAAKILERGCNSFIQKPFSMKALSMKVREVMDDSVD